MNKLTLDDWAMALICLTALIYYVTVAWVMTGTESLKMKIISLRSRSR